MRHSDSEAGEGGFKKFEGVEDSDWSIGFLVCLLDPGLATGVACDHNLSLSLSDIGPFSVEQLAGFGGLEDVIGTSRTTAEFSFGEGDEGDTGNGFEQVFGHLRDFLTMNEVAGFVVGDSDIC